jgi:Fur family ferric uptake transcriptional regulator
MTHQRKVILEEIKKVDSHPTADELYERVRKKLPKISMGTVYRNLDILTSIGLIKKLEPERPQMRFDGNTKEHYHISCMHCGRIQDAPIEPLGNTLESLEKTLGNLTKHGIFGHKLEFFGLCSRCIETEKD